MRKRERDSKIILILLFSKNEGGTVRDLVVGKCEHFNLAQKEDS